MIRGKALAKQFRSATWSSDKEMDAFVAATGEVPPVDLLRLLPLLSDRALQGSATAHHDRCTVFLKLTRAAPSPELFVPLVKAMTGADQTLLGIITDLLPTVNNVAAHPDLCRVLASPDAATRKAAASVLDKVAGKTCFRVLSDWVRRPEFAGKVEALRVLVPKAGHHAIPMLSAVIESGSPAERVYAAQLLADKRYVSKDLPAALEVVVKALDDTDEHVLSQAIESYAALASEDEFLHKLEDRLESPNPQIVQAIVQALVGFPSGRVVRLLARRLRAGPNVVRLAVLAAFEVIATEDVLQPLVDALSHRQIIIRSKAAEVLSNLAKQGKVDVARTVLWLLRSHDVNVRRLAVEIANSAGHSAEQLAPRLLRYVRDEDWWVRERVMDALVEIAGPSLTNHLTKYLEDPSDVVRRYAIEALMRLQDRRALGALVRTAQGDEDWWVRERAVQAMAALGDPRAGPYLVDLMLRDDSLRLVCVDALGELGHREAASHVANLLADAPAALRLAIVRCLAAFDDPAAAFALDSFRSDEDHDVRMAVRELLGRWDMLDVQDEPTQEGKLSALDRLLVTVQRSGGDDLLIAPSQVPYMKRLGKMTPLSDTPLSAEEVGTLLLPRLTAVQRDALEQCQDVDFSYDVPSRTLRFRCHVFHQLAGLCAVFRIVQSEVPNFAKLGLPDVVRSFAELKNGLVLVGGPTGSGKSTTLAALIDYINCSSKRHIVSLEDPIEVVHECKESLINQREIGSHTRSFAVALRSTLRQDPDVILVGEMRDLDTIAFAVTAAETGHLVFGTVHTASADTSVDRLINVFPPRQQPQVRSMLAESLRAIVCQHLLRRCDRPGRIAAVEVMINNDAVSNMIRKGKAYQLPSTIATSRDIGMQTMDGELARLVAEGVVETEEAFMKAYDKKAFDTMIGAGRDEPSGAGGH